MDDGWWGQVLGPWCKLDFENFELESLIRVVWESFWWLLKVKKRQRIYLIFQHTYQDLEGRSFTRLSRTLLSPFVNIWKSWQHLAPNEYRFSTSLYCMFEFDLEEDFCSIYVDSKAIQFSTIWPVQTVLGSWNCPRLCTGDVNGSNIPDFDGQ